MSKTRVGMLGPCLGVGGGDALMLGLVKHCTNTEFTGIFVSNRSEYRHIEWAKKACNLPPIHERTENKDQVQDGIIYHDSYTDAIHATVKDCDIVFMWCIDSLDQNILGLTCKPYINYAQNCDTYAKKCIESNKKITTYYAACSRTAASILPPGPQTVIYNGIDPSRVAPGVGRNQQRKLWGLEDKKILLFMGRFVREKHPEMAVTALAHLPDDWVTVFVGTGYQDKEVYKLAQAMYPDRVFFIDPVYQVGDMLAAADVFFLPSDFEGHSLALCEAWLAGTPTVYADFDAAKEMEALHGSLGTMIPRVSNPQLCADAIIEAGSESNTVLAKVGLARSTVWQNYTLPTIAIQWEEYFDRCLFDWRKKRRHGRIHLTKPMVPMETV